ncbi:type VII secretion-associated serine protease mycosin [Stackebrandtia albiflava]|uniref:Type VII secretion-associated serine protease mycosin n=1 Tax=Stackebrandtia albiflava TaxID=406432 RepID=A0A562UPE7_9ACTN|nr:S8 family serine peptidase [Stackebrandtia albiflava]TWJ07499.1 type VII secretion-associated serine protease mycosin [Stackebrandtia albiflava]
MRLVPRLAALTVSSVAAAGLLVASPQPAWAGDDCENKPRDSVVADEVPDANLWPQRLLKPELVWPNATGEGVTVAVLDSGVQADHPLLDGKVDSGKAYIDVESTDKDEQNLGDGATRDCVGHGTAVAGIIAGSESPENGFHGMAPDARILPIRIANTVPADQDDANEDKDDNILVDQNDFAAAIDYAVSQDVDVINMSLKFSVDHPVIAEAVAAAVDAGIVLVASAGNEGNIEEDPEAATTPSYPAAYEGVIGVGAVNSHLVKTAESQWGPWVDVVAPGLEIGAPQHDGNFQIAFGGTSSAAAYVAGTAALLVEMYPDWTPEEIAIQIMGTASSVAGATRSDQYGYGMVDPVRAATERLSGSEPEPVLSMDPPVLTEQQVQNQEFDAMAMRWATSAGVAALAVFTAALLGVAALRRGKRARWRIGRASREDMIEPVDDGDPIALFQGIKGLKQ